MVERRNEVVVDVEPRMESCKRRKVDVFAVREDVERIRPVAGHVCGKVVKARHTVLPQRPAPHEYILLALAVRRDHVAAGSDMHGDGESARVVGKELVHWPPHRDSLSIRCVREGALGRRVGPVDNLRGARDRLDGACAVVVRAVGIAAKPVPYCFGILVKVEPVPTASAKRLASLPRVDKNREHGEKLRTEAVIVASGPHCAGWAFTRRPVCGCVPCPGGALSNCRGGHPQFRQYSHFNG